MSSPIPTPPSLHSDPDDSRDTTSSDFSNSGMSKYNTIEHSQINDCKINAVTSHGVEDIVSESVSYIVNDNLFADCKTEMLSTFVQDFNSRDSTGFSIQDILGLHQSYIVGNSQDNLGLKYEDQMPNYENISNNSNNCGSGTEEVVTENCPVKSDEICSATATHIGNQVIYSRSDTTNELVQCHKRSDLSGDVAKDPEREINDVHDSTFLSQVIDIEKYVLLNQVSEENLYFCHA